MKIQIQFYADTETEKNKFFSYYCKNIDRFFQAKEYFSKIFKIRAIFFVYEINGIRASIREDKFSKTNRNQRLIKAFRPSVDFIFEPKTGKKKYFYIQYKD
mgnify:CR=1 FL=1